MYYIAGPNRVGGGGAELIDSSFMVIIYYCVEGHHSYFLFLIF